MRSIELFDRAVKLYPNNIAFVEDGVQISYAEAGQKTHQVAQAIHACGYRAGDKVAILAPNSIEAFIALLGIMRAEMVWLPVNYRNSVEDSADTLARFGCNLLLSYSANETDAKAIAAQAGIDRVMAIDDGETSFSSLSEYYPTDTEPFVMSPEDPDALFAIFPTGGTTGPSKGVMLTHRVMEVYLASLFTHLDYEAGGRHLVVAPMTHTAGTLGFPMFLNGGCNYIMRQADPLLVMQQIEEHGITHLFLPPTVIVMMLAHPQVREFDYHTLQHFIVGAAPISTEKFKEAVEIFGPSMTELYGQTECPAIILCKTAKDYLQTDGSVDEKRLRAAGRPSAFTQVELMDDSGNLMGVNEPGEIVTRGNLVTPGYYQNPQATEEVRQYGWHHTGDVGVRDSDGYITIVDRKKDMIISGGFNVYPNEVEQVISLHPAVQESAVIGIPDEKWGEAVKAVVMLKPGKTLNEPELIAFLKGKLGSVKSPKSVDFIEDLPRSANGKVLKRVLRDKYWQYQERNIS